jgi:hypothetical protein
LFGGVGVALLNCAQDLGEVVHHGPQAFELSGQDRK